jgi:hypothetical protein
MSGADEVIDTARLACMYRNSQAGRRTQRPKFGAKYIHRLIPDYSRGFQQYLPVCFTALSTGESGIGDRIAAASCREKER